MELRKGVVQIGLSVVQLVGADIPGLRMLLPKEFHRKSTKI